jgi:hypothetical protein
MGDVGTAIDNPDNYGSAVFQIRNPYSSSQRQCRMRGRQLVLIEGFAACCHMTLEPEAVPARQPNLHPLVTPVVLWRGPFR